jgi:death-on-curing protein
MVRVRVDSLSKEALKKINKKFSEQGVRSEAEIDYIVFKVAGTRGINRKAATMLIETARRHPFVDGNKRTAYEAAIALLEANGKKLEVGASSRFNVVVWSVKPRTQIEEIVEWIANHTRK